MLSKRMKAIADMVPVCECVADIGCDHGFIDIKLIQDKKAGHAVAMDINEGPLLRAKEHIRQYGLEDRIEVRLSDGAKELKSNEADTAIIAGMGGRLITRIISDDMEKFRAMKSLILSPHTETENVRSFLCEKGFRTEDEDMVFEDDKYYTIIRCRFAGGDVQKPDEAGILYGPVLIEKKHPVLKGFLENELSKFDEIEMRMREGGSEALERKLPELDSKRKMLRNILEKY